MRLTIAARDKKANQDFHYDLEISDKQVILTTLAICGTILACIALKRFKA
ncbi:hypothetical protein [Streptococcus henryi]|jgi:hypothetical protein